MRTRVHTGTRVGAVTSDGVHSRLGLGHPRLSSRAKDRGNNVDSPISRARRLRIDVLDILLGGGLALPDTVPVVVCLSCKCSVCVRGGRLAGSWDGAAAWRMDGASQGEG